MKEMLEMIKAMNKLKMEVVFFLGVMRLGLGFRPLLGNVLLYGDT